MKRQILKRKRIATYKCISSNLTKASSKKKQTKRIRPKKRIPSANTQISSEPIKSSPQHKSSKSQSQTTETTGNTPFSFPLSEYLSDIQSHIMELDYKYHLMLLKGLESAKQGEITSEMRTILLNWLVKVGGKFRVKSQTIHMCVQLIDYMLIFKGEIIQRKKFQLLGVACLFISCKYSQIYTAEAEKYIQYCDGQYKLADLFEMEGIILEQIGFKLQIPSIQQFLMKMINDYQLCQEQQKSIKILLDMVIFDFNLFNSFQKQYLAVAIISVTNGINKQDRINQQIQKNLKQSTLRKCKMAVIQMYRKNTPLEHSSFISI